MESKQSITCDICNDKTKVQEIIRGQKIRIIYPHTPFVEPNLLFVPIRHVERFEELDPEEMVDLLSMVRAASAGLRDLYGVIGFNFFMNNGQKAGQHSPHVHFHLLGRTNNEAVSPLKILNNPGDYSIARLSDDELSRRVALISATIRKNLPE